MTRSLRNHCAAVARQLVLLGGVCLLLLACGSGDPTAATTQATTSAALPTPVPTTPPLSLPPADASLPELAPLPAGSTTAVPPTAVATEASIADSAPATEASDGAVAVPADAVVLGDAAEPTPDSSSSPAGSPSADTTVEPAPQDDASLALTTAQDSSALVMASADRWSECVLLAADATQATNLLDPLAAGTATDMSSVQLNTLAAASVGCDLVASGLSATDIGDYVPTGTTCMNAWLESSGGGSVFVGLASVGWGQSTPAWAQAHFVDALDSCFTGASFAADVMSVVSADGSLTGAFDAACLATSFDSSGTLRSFAQSLASHPASATIPVSLSDSWVLNCANVGQMVAVAAAADGVALSGSTISCIDSELKGTGVVAGLVAGTADTDAVGIATIACLTDAEASALLG